MSTSLRFRNLFYMLFGVLLLTVTFVVPHVALATTPYKPQEIVFDPNNNVARNTGLGNASPVDTVAGIINWTLSFLAVAALVLVIYAGFRWLFSGGVAEVVQTAKDILVGALIGLIIILASYGITNYVFSNLVNATVNGPTELE